jgi:hypothetical protein
VVLATTAVAPEGVGVTAGPGDDVQALIEKAVASAGTRDRRTREVDRCIRTS